MLMLLRNPWIILGALSAVLTAYFYGHHAGFAQRDAEMQAEISIKNEEARKVEQNLREELNQTSIQLVNANDSITQKQSALERAINSGRVHIRASSCVQASPSPAPVAGRGDEARSQPYGQADSNSDDSERQTLAAIAAVVAQGDRNTAQLNACIDAYNAVREQINAQGK